MGRLIDAERLLAKVVEANPMGGMIGGKFIEDLIKAEPTAYDVDKVAEQLEKWQRQSDDGLIAVGVAIEIVKGAVKHEGHP